MIHIYTFRMSSSEKPLIVAHRGASHDAPENTLSSFMLAWEQEADAVECDIWMTSDQQLVCLHDKTTKRTARKNLDATKSSFDELSKLDVGIKKGRQWKDERIPLLEDVLAAVPEGKKIIIEIKDDVALLSFLGKVIKESALLNNQIIILSFSQDVVRESKKIMPEVKTLLGLDKIPGVGVVLKLLAAVDANGVDVKDLKAVNEDFIGGIKNPGFEVHVWTVNTKKSFLRYCALGVDSVTTDKPAVMRAIN